MTQSPGHQKHPNHKVREKPLNERVQAEVLGEVLADSMDVIELDEDNYPIRYYFARSDVRMSKLKKSDTKTTCPFKGEASYYHISVDGKTFHDAAWSYEDPYDEHRALKDRIVFYDDKDPEIQVRRSA